MMVLKMPGIDRTRTARLLEGVPSLLLVGPEVEVRVKCPPRLTALVNQDLLEQALLNVAANAAKYVESGRIELRSSTANGRVVVAISDTGPGMSREERERAFDRFRRGDSD